MTVIIAMAVAAGVMAVGWYPAREAGNARGAHPLLVQPFADYRAVCGYPIVVSRTPRRSLAIEDERGRQVIAIDPSLTTSDETFHRVFMIAHECAHHRMGHSTSEGRAMRVASRRVVRDQELSADCWAAETLGRLGLARYSRIMADRFQRAGPYSPGGGYPSGVQRATIIRECAAAGRRSGRTPRKADTPKQPSAG